MVRKDRTVFVGLRIPEGLLEKIDEDVEMTKEFSSRTDYIVCSIREMMAIREGRLKHTTLGEPEDKAE